MAVETYINETNRRDFSMQRRTYSVSTGTWSSPTTVNYTDVIIGAHFKRGEKRPFPTRVVGNDTAYTHTLNTRRFGVIDYRSYTSSGVPGTWVTGTWPGLLTPHRPALPTEYSPSDRARMRIAVTEKFLNTRMELGVELAELPKTMRFVRDSASAIYRTFRSFRRGNWRAVADDLGLIGKDKSRFSDPSLPLARRWLEYKYALSPIMYSVEDACTVLSNGLGNWYFTASSRQGKKGNGDSFELSASNGMKWKRTVHSYGMSCALTFDVSSEGMRTFSQLGLANPLSIAWELVPFSFVADWFVPIGGWLSALGHLSFSSFKSGSITEIYDTEDELLPCRVSTSGGYYDLTPAGAKTSLRDFKCVRTLVTSGVPPMPLPEFGLDSHQMLTSVSLLRTIGDAKLDALARGLRSRRYTE